MNVNKSAIEITSREIYSKPSTLFVKENDSYHSFVDEKEDISKTNSNPFVRASFSRSSLGNYIYHDYDEDADYEFLKNARAFSLGKAKGEHLRKYQKKSELIFPTSRLLNIDLDCPFDLDYYGFELEPDYNKYHECTGILVCSSSSKSDSDLYEKRQENCPLHLSDKITSFNSVYFHDENTNPDNLVKKLKLELEKKQRIQLSISRRISRQPRTPVIDNRCKRRPTIINKIDEKNISNDTLLDPIDRINLLDRSWTPKSEKDDEIVHESFSVHRDGRKVFDSRNSDSKSYNPLRPNHFSSSSVRSLKNRSDGKFNNNLNSPSNTSNNYSFHEPSTPLPSIKSPKKSLRDINSFNTREIGKTQKIDLKKESGCGFGFKLGSRDTLVNNEEPVFITHITYEGPADRDGRLKIGDRILELEGSRVNTFKECIECLKSKGSGEMVSLLISRQTDSDQEEEADDKNLQDHNNNNNNTIHYESDHIRSHSESIGYSNYDIIRAIVVIKGIEDIDKPLGLSMKWIPRENKENEQSKYPGFYVQKVHPYSLVCPQDHVGHCEVRPNDYLALIDNESLAEPHEEKTALELINKVIDDAKRGFRRNAQSSFLRNIVDIDPVVFVLTFKRFKKSPDNSYVQNDRQASNRSISSPPITKRIKEKDSKADLLFSDDEFGVNTNFVRDGLGRKSMSNKRPVGVLKESVNELVQSLDEARRGYQTMPSSVKVKNLRSSKVKLEPPVKSPVPKYCDNKIENIVPPPLPLRTRTPTQSVIPPQRNKAANIYSSISYQQEVPNKPATRSKPKNSILDFVRMNSEQMKNSLKNNSGQLSTRSHEQNQRSYSATRRAKTPTRNLQKFHPNDFDYLNSNILKESFSYPKNMDSVLKQKNVNCPSKNGNLHIQDIYDPKDSSIRISTTPNFRENTLITSPTYPVKFKNLREQRLLDVNKPIIPERRTIIEFLQKSLKTSFPLR